MIRKTRYISSARSGMIRRKRWQGMLSLLLAALLVLILPLNSLLALDPEIVRLRHLLPAGREKQEQKQYEVSQLHPSSSTSAS